MLRKQVLFGMIDAFALLGVMCLGTGCASTDAQLKLCMKTLQDAADLTSGLDPVPVEQALFTFADRLIEFDERLEAVEGQEWKIVKK